jgi:hypothetical protein
MSQRKPNPKTNAQGEVVHAVKVRNVVRAVWKRWVRLLDDDDLHVGPNLTRLIRADIKRLEAKGEQ